jgi:hypothetical protein
MGSITPNIVADAFEDGRNEWYRPTRWFGATVEITEVDAKPKRVGSSLHDDRVTVVYCIRHLDDSVKENLLEGLVDLEVFLDRLRSNRRSVRCCLPQRQVDLYLKRCELSRERSDGVAKYVGIFETEGSAIALKVFISLKRDLRQKALGRSTCLGLVGYERPKSVRPVIIYLVDGENDTTGHFGRSV